MLPKFKIAVELDEPFYQPGQKVRGTLSARYFFGKPVENGEVKVEVRASGGPKASLALRERGRG